MIPEGWSAKKPKIPNLGKFHRTRLQVQLMIQPFRSILDLDKKWITGLWTLSRLARWSHFFAKQTNAREVAENRGRRRKKRKVISRLDAGCTAICLKRCHQKLSLKRARSLINRAGG